MISLKKTLALACIASMLDMGAAMAQTDPAPAAGGAMGSGDAMSSDTMMKKPMMKKHMSKKSMKKKDMMKSM